jgi:hypothetical protein
MVNVLELNDSTKTVTNASKFSLGKRVLFQLSEIMQFRGCSNIIALILNWFQIIVTPNAKHEISKSGKTVIRKGGVYFMIVCTILLILTKGVCI